nr:PepSY-associated TM helix domain-containing protein [uncultured Carboxylicivirga sp.]
MAGKFKIINDKLHLWLGLISAPIVFFVCITGTIIVFSDEVMEWSAGDALYVDEVKPTRLPSEKLLTILQKRYPHKHSPSYMVTYRDPKRSVRFNSYSTQEGLQMIYMDPYTGTILKEDATIHFFYITAHIHNSFLLHKPGAWIIDIAVLIFLFELLSGLVMWWPKKWNKKHRKAAFTVKVNASGSRINSDIHKVFGFYGLAIAFVLTTTGLLIAFQPFSNITQNAFGGDASIRFDQVFTQNVDSLKEVSPIDAAIQKTWNSHPDKTEIQLYTYWLNDWGYYVMNVANNIGLKSAMNNDFIAFDKYTGDKVELQPELIVNEKVKNAFWTLHMGNYIGIWGKILTFIGGLICSMLPITGFYIWWNKKKKSKQNKRAFEAI